MELGGGQWGLGSGPGFANSLTLATMRFLSDSGIVIPVIHRLWREAPTVEAIVDDRPLIHAARLAWPVAQVALAVFPMFSTDPCGRLPRHG